MSADEMFEKLGYSKTEYKENIHYESNNLKEIEFNLDDKTIECYKTRFTTPDGVSDYIDLVEEITMQELKAINKKCEEMGWIE